MRSSARQPTVCQAERSACGRRLGHSVPNAPSIAPPIGIHSSFRSSFRPLHAPVWPSPRPSRRVPSRTRARRTLEGQRLSDFRQRACQRSVETATPGPAMEVIGPGKGEGVGSRGLAGNCSGYAGRLERGLYPGRLHTATRSLSSGVRLTRPRSQLVAAADRPGIRNGCHLLPAWLQNFQAAAGCESTQASR